VTEPIAEGLDPWDAALLAAIEPTDENLVPLDVLAARSGISAPVLEALTREGLLLAKRREPEPLFDPADADALAAGLGLVEAGLPLAELFDLARKMDKAMRPIAEEAVATFARFVRDSVEAEAASPEEAARRLVEAFRAMLPRTGALVDHHFRRLLIEVARARLQA
jgi:DNA-binding transcriptional MerR regulator